MATTQKIQSLIDDIQKNCYFLPEFQRGFRWNSEQVKKYFQSLYRGFPQVPFWFGKPSFPPKLRAQKYLRDNPSENPEAFKSLEKRLQFFDISEYCELMVSGSNWQYFETYFGSKGAVQSRFTQLQNLRNTLAHNRDLTDVIIKDDEAAILWFSSILRRYSLAAA